MSFCSKLLIRHSSSNARSRSTYKWFLPFQTRWLDNDNYGHMNNAVYHGIFDSVINIFLIRHCGLDISLDKSELVGFMVTNKCDFFAPTKYPEIYLIGLHVPKIGKSSINYQIGMFPMNDSNSNLTANLTHGYYESDLGSLQDLFSDSASCVGQSTHVLVKPSNDNKPTPIPENWRNILIKLQ